MTGVTSSCPYCGEEVEVTVEETGVASETYVEDCPVCCRPWTVHVSREASAEDGDRDGEDGFDGGGEPTVWLGREDD